MSLEANLKQGMLAIKYVKGLGMRSSNKSAHRNADAPGGIEGVIARKQGWDNTALNGVDNTRDAAKLVPTWRDENDLARARRYGNCGELASIALEYLFDHGIRAEYFHFTEKGYDHAWVVIGRVPNSILNNLKTWGPDAVWCDPWQGDDGVCFSIQDFVKGKIRNLNARYKCNTLELVEAGKPKPDI